MAFGRMSVKPGAPTRINPRSVAAKPHFPVGARPKNVYGPHINEHPKPMGEPMAGPAASASPTRSYGKPDGFAPFGGV